MELNNNLKQKLVKEDLLIEIEELIAKLEDCKFNIEAKVKLDPTQLGFLESLGIK